MIMKWAEGFQCQLMWHDIIDQKVCRWRVRTWLDNQMLHGRMREDSMVGNELYLKSGCCRWQISFSFLVT